MKPIQNLFQHSAHGETLSNDSEASENGLQTWHDQTNFPCFFAVFAVFAVVQDFFTFML